MNGRLSSPPRAFRCASLARARMRFILTEAGDGTADARAWGQRLWSELCVREERSVRYVAGRREVAKMRVLPESSGVAQSGVLTESGAPKEPGLCEGTAGI